MKTDLRILAKVGCPAAFLACVVLAGCSQGPSDQPDIGTVSGTVTLDGEPLPDATVTFQPSSGRPSFAVTNQSGYYELQYTPDTPGAKIGEHQVSISTYQEPESQEKPETAVPEKVPAEYNTNAADNPEMTKQVEAGSNTIDFALESGGEIVQPDYSGENEGEATEE